MRTIKGTTENETNIIKAIQNALKIDPDGCIGESTLTSIAAKVKADCWPCTISIYGNPVIICKDIDFSCVRTSLNRHGNSISGTFNNGKSVCSILVNNGNVVCGNSCHFYDGEGYPETVLFRSSGGIVEARRVKTVGELPESFVWAVGGLGLLGFYAPSVEGFKGRFSDVLRKTNHTVLGVKDNLMYLCYMRDMSAEKVNNTVKKMGLEYAVMLDGGHYAAINGSEQFAKINLTQAQLCVIKAV